MITVKIKDLSEELDMKLTKQIEQQILFTTIKVIRELVKTIQNPSDYGLSETGRSNLAFRMIQMHNQLPL